MTGIQVSNSLLKGTKLQNSFQFGSLQSCYFSFLFSICLALDSKAFCFCNRYTDAFFFAEQSIRVPIPCSRIGKVDCWVVRSQKTVGDHSVPNSQSICPCHCNAGLVGFYQGQSHWVDLVPAPYQN